MAYISAYKIGEDNYTFLDFPWKVFFKIEIESSIFKNLLIVATVGFRGNIKKLDNVDKVW